jgi:hypothetical protein
MAVRFVVWLRALAPLLVLAVATGTAHADIPGGTPLPSPNDSPHQTSGEATIAYYLASASYRFQGQYDFTYNASAIGKSIPYFFADVDIEALSDNRHNFQPDRLAGTFELGARRLFGVTPLGVLVRHQSPHNIDRNDRRQGSWNMIAARWKLHSRAADFNFSFGRYLRPIIVFDYAWDFDVQATRSLGRFGGRTWTLRADIHHITENGPRGGFTDYWIEPGTSLGPHVEGYLGMGQVHDIDVFGGRTDHPVLVGLRMSW